MAIEITWVQAIVGVLGALGSALGAWAVFKRAETDSRSQQAQVQSAAAMQLTQQQGAFQTQLIGRVDVLEKRVIEERDRCDEQIAEERKRRDQQIAEERARCDGELDSMRTEISRLHTEIARMRRGEGAPVRHNDPS